MKDVISSGNTVAYHDPDERYENEHPLLDVPEPGHEDKLRKILEWHRQAKENQAINRLEMHIDRDFYDSLQLTDEEKQELVSRGQPPITKNLIAPAVDWILGTEKRTRMDFRVYPRKDTDEANENAINKTRLLKHNNDVNKSGFARSRAFEDSVIVGLGWLEDGIRNDETDAVSYSRAESWRNIWYDHLSMERDLSDSRFLFREKWVDIDIAKAMFPEYTTELNAAAISHNNLGYTDDDEFYGISQLYFDTDNHGYPVSRSALSGEPYNVNNRRTRVKLVECWYREPQMVTRMRGFDSELSGQEYDKDNEAHVRAIYEEIVSTFDAVVMKTRCAIFCEDYLLQDLPSPYKHNHFPFTAIWGKRRGRDNAPYGVVRSMRDAQRDYNARASKALFILSTNQVIAEEDAVEDWDEVRDQAAAPDGIIRLVSGAGMQQKRFELNNDKALAEEHLMLMNQDADFLQRASGVTDENLGQDSKAVSGKAILAKQQEGSVVTFLYFDNLRYALQLQGEKQLANIEQFYDMPQTVRIIGDNAKHEFVNLNEPVFDPVSGQMVVKNDITAEQTDFIIDTEDFRQTVRQAQFDSMMEMVTRLPPEMVMSILDLIIEMSDIQGKDEWVKRIRSINGQRDPDEKETLEQQQERMAAEAEAQRQKEISEQQIQADIEKKSAEAERAKGDAAKAMSDADRAAADAERIRAETARTNVESVKEATEAAATMAAIPEVAPIADELLESAGFEDKGSIESINIPRPSMPMPDKSVVEAAKDYKNPVAPEGDKPKPTTKQVKKDE